MANIFYLGPAGGVVAIDGPTYATGWELERPFQGGTHQLLGGGRVRDRVGDPRSTYRLRWRALTPEDLSTLEALANLPGPLVFMDPTRRNLLTTNQSMGTDSLRSTVGFSAFTQGTVSSSTTQFRSWSRALAWNTVTALAATDRGVRLFTDVATIDATWTPVRPSTQYTISGYLRSTAAVSMSAGFNWYDTAGALLTSVAGAGVALSTSNFNTRVTHTATSHASAAYGIGKFLNTTTTGAAITVYLDELMMEEDAAASTFVVGSGVPRVTVDNPPTLGQPLLRRFDGELALIEV